MGTRCADHVTPLYPQKLELTSPTGGGRSVGIVPVRTKATEFSLVVVVVVVVVIVVVVVVVVIVVVVVYWYVLQADEFHTSKLHTLTHVCPQHVAL